jgi:hypothetical protein
VEVYQKEAQEIYRQALLALNAGDNEFIRIGSWLHERYEKHWPDAFLRTFVNYFHTVLIDKNMFATEYEFNSTATSMDIVLKKGARKIYFMIYGYKAVAPKMEVSWNLCQ